MRKGQPIPDDMSPTLTYMCDVEETDQIEVSRVGPVGNLMSRVAVAAIVVEPTTVTSMDDDEIVAAHAAVILTPLDARRLACALIEFADECDGMFTNLQPRISPPTDPQAADVA